MSEVATVSSEGKQITGVVSLEKGSKIAHFCAYEYMEKDLHLPNDQTSSIKLKAINEKKWNSNSNGFKQIGGFVGAVMGGPTALAIAVGCWGNPAALVTGPVCLIAFGLGVGAAGVGGKVYLDSAKVEDVWNLVTSPEAKTLSTAEYSKVMLSLAKSGNTRKPCEYITVQELKSAIEAGKRLKLEIEK